MRKDTPKAGNEKPRVPIGVKQTEEPKTTGNQKSYIEETRQRPTSTARGGGPNDGLAVTGGESRLGKLVVTERN